MPAQVAANLPFDPPAPPPAARSQVPASGAQFLNLLALPKSGSASSDGANAIATARVTTTGNASRSNDTQNANGDRASTGDRQNNSNQAANADGAARVMMVPVPIPPQPVPQPAGSAASAGATVALGGPLAVPQPAPSSPADAAALLLLAANAATGTGTAQPAAATAPGTGTSATGVTATASQTALPGPVLPAMVATLSMRLAASALTLVSQPRVTLASATPEITALPKLGASEADLAALGRAALATEAAHGASTPGTAATTIGIDELLAAAAKDAIAAASQLSHATTDQSAPALLQAAGNPGAATVPQIATITPPPPTLANELPIAMAIPPHAVAEQVAVTLRQAVNSGSDHIQIQLQPADLGAVEVKLSINHDGRVTVVVSADRSDTLNLLQQDAGSLAQALRDAGLQADSSNLSFNLRGGYQFNQQQSGFAGAPPVDDISAGGIDGITAATALRAHAGSLDIHV
jgi:flagellar hook-length control protein FliK